MPTYKLTYYENYYAEIVHEVEADNEQEARDIADELEANHTTPPEQIMFEEWNFDSIEEIKQ